MAYCRFFKADLQMQTPVDRFHWRGTPLGPTATAEERQAAARQYMTACYESGLEVIAVTEHNICPDDTTSLIPELEAAAQELSGVYKRRITIFPGFEISGPFGRGGHVLCIFEPGTSVEVLSGKLSQLGIPPGNRFADKKPVPAPTQHTTADDLLRIVQRDVNNPGLVILAHPTAASGVMDDKTITQDWSADIIKNEEFLCIEISKPRPELEAQQGLLPSILRNEDPRYERRHPIGALCNSDTKGLSPAETDTNYIGFRHTWIKMAKPNIAGLRQAFLDHGSRIRFGEARPEDTYNYPQVRQVLIRGAAFLEDQTIELSPNLNVLIGGSGSGKSTIIAYMRMALGQVEHTYGLDVSKNLAKLLDTVRSDTEVKLTFEMEGTPFEFASKGKVTSTSTANGLPSVDRLFPVRFFGQREIYAIAEDRSARKALVDNFISDELARLGRDRSQLTDKLLSHDQELAREEELREQLAAIEAQRTTLKLKIDNLTRTSGSLSEFHDLSSQEQAVGHVRTNALNSVDEIISSVSLVSFQQHDGAAEAVVNATRLANQAWSVFAQEVETLGSRLKVELDEALAADDTVVTVGQRLEELRPAAAEALEQLREAGANPDDLDKYRNELDSLNDEVAEVSSALSQMERLRTEKASLHSELTAVWKKETAARKTKAHMLNSAFPSRRSGKPFVEVDVAPFGDDQAFYEEMEQFHQDRRRISDVDWGQFTAAAFEATESDGNPAATVADWIGSLNSGTEPEGFPWTAGDRRTQCILGWFDRSALSKLSLIRVPDRILITLRRSDDTIAGELEQGLSNGQKCTAILAILLAENSVPLVVDQPEEEIDNEFIYTELIPLLRQVKESRQILLVTHDPNIPVVGDAEMIHALEARDGRGKIKQIGGSRAVGGLDEPKVRTAVEMIMEGSADAFQRRYVKYGY